MAPFARILALLGCFLPKDVVRVSFLVPIPRTVRRDIHLTEQQKVKKVLDLDLVQMSPDTDGVQCYWEAEPLDYFNRSLQKEALQLAQWMVLLASDLSLFQKRLYFKHGRPKAFFTAYRTSILLKDELRVDRNIIAHPWNDRNGWEVQVQEGQARVQVLAKILKGQSDLHNMALDLFYSMSGMIDEKTFLAWHKDLENLAAMKVKPRRRAWRRPSV